MITKVGVMIGVGAAKTGLFWMRLGGGEEDEAEEEEEEPSLAKAQGRRNVALLREDWAAGEAEVRQAPLIEAEDIVHAALDLV